MKPEKIDAPMYWRIAREAARLEKNRQYYQASKTWLKAATVSINYKNIVWARNRAEFCQYQIERDRLCKVVRRGTIPA